MLSAMDGNVLARVLYEPDRDESGAVTVPGTAVVDEVRRRLAAPVVPSAPVETVVGDVGASISGVGDRCVRVSVTDLDGLREAAWEAGLGLVDEQRGVVEVFGDEDPRITRRSSGREGETASRSGLSSLLAQAQQDELAGNPDGLDDVYRGFVVLTDQDRSTAELSCSARAAYRGARELFQVEVRDGVRHVMAMVDGDEAEELLRRWMDGDVTLLSDPRWRPIDG